MYRWRQLNEQQRKQMLASRQKNHRPWHSPPHFESDGNHGFHLSAACYEHLPIIGTSVARMEEFESRLIEVFSAKGCSLHAWCVLPNHWHALVSVDDLKEMLKEIGRLHGRISFQWNHEDEARGRKCWHRCSDRRIRSYRHHCVARNYIHHNPVKHDYVKEWEEWPYSSAGTFIADAGHETVLAQWQEYPVLDMGKGWDD